MDPFAPVPNSASTGTAQAPCPRCGNPMDPSAASYDEAGQLICRTCAATNAVAQANRTIEEKDPTSTRNLYLGSVSAAAAGLAAVLLVSTCVLFIASPIAILTGGWTIHSLLAHPETKTQLGGGWWLVLALSIAGALLGLFAIVIAVLAIIVVGVLETHGGY